MKSFVFTENEISLLRAGLELLALEYREKAEAADLSCCIELNDHFDLMCRDCEKLRQSLYSTNIDR